MERDQGHHYSVGEICSLTGITRKTLFYYDRIDLLKPTDRVGSSNYKEYDAAAYARLKKILFYKEAGLRLYEIKMILDDSACDTVKIYKKVKERLVLEIEEREKMIQRIAELSRKDY